MFELILIALFFFNSNVGVELSALAEPAALVKPAEPSNSSKQNTNDSLTKKQNQADVLKDSGKEYLVEKLDYLNKSLPKNHKAGKALNLRLAHTLSLIAEENFISFEKEKCSECLKKAQASARRSLSIYKQLDSVLLKHALLHTTALFKQAYLEKFLGNKAKSLSLLKRVARKQNISELLITRAWYNIGEIYFELYDYKQALSAFNQVLKIKSPWEFKAAYRKIWSLFNLSRYQESIERLIAFLKSDLYSNAQLKDQNFQQKLESELVVLYSYSEITNQNLDFLYKFNKQKAAQNTQLERNRRFFDLAEALNRIGRLKASNQVWKAYLANTNNLEERLLAHSLMLDNDLTLNYTNKLFEVGKKVEEIFILQKKMDKYKDKTSLKIQRFFKQVSTKKKLKTKESKEYLLSLYQQYNSVYPVNLNVLLAAAGLADSLKKYVLAGELFRKSFAYMNSPEEQKLKESVSVRQMELAELTKNDQNRLTAYNFYIENGADESLVFKAKYQTAYIAYSKKQFKKANDLFYQLAVSKTKTKNEAVRELEIKSAHLSLSALDQMGNQEELLMNQAGLFMEHFPANRQEFSRIYNSAVLNTVKKLAAGKNFSRRPFQASRDENILKAWEVLGRFSVKDADDSKLSNYYLNKLLLAKELLKYEQMNQSLKFLLVDKKLSKEDKKMALTWKLWLAELRFDFTEVLRIVKILNPSSQSEDQLLSLARLSELAGADPRPYYKAVLKKFPNSSWNLVVLNSLIEKASSNKEKKKLLTEHFAFYKKDVNKLTYLILKLDEGELDSSFISFFTKAPFMQNTFLDLFEKRRQTIKAFEDILQKAKAYSLSSQTSDSRLKFKLKKWTQAVNELQKSADRLLSSQDWTARVFIFSHWSQELKRFYNSVMNLPLPKGLTEEESLEYKTLLSNQLNVYAVQIKQLEAELKTLWSQNFISDYKAGFKQSSVFYAPLKWELNKVLELAEGKQKNQIQSLLSSLMLKLKEQKMKTKADKVDVKAVNSLYKTLRQNPFDAISLTELLNLEKQRNNEALSFYLANRIKELKTAGEKNQL